VKAAAYTIGGELTAESRGPYTESYYASALPIFASALRMPSLCNATLQLRCFLAEAHALLILIAHLLVL